MDRRIEGSWPWHRLTLGSKDRRIEGSWPCWFAVHDRIAWIVGSGGPIFLGDFSISETSVDHWHRLTLRIWWIAWIEGSWPCWFTVHDRIAWIVGSGGPIFLGDISISETSVDQWHLFICWLRYSLYKRILVRAGSLVFSFSEKFNGANHPRINGAKCPFWQGFSI